MKLFVVLATVLMVAVLAYAGDGILMPKTPSDLNAGAGPEFQAYSPQKGMGYAQGWIFWAWNEKGEGIIAQYIISNTGLQKNFPAYNVTYFPASGDPVGAFGEFNAKDLKANKEKFDISFTNAKAKGAHPDYKIELSDPKLAYKLNFKAGCPSFKFAGDGRIGLGGKDFYRNVIMAPTADVSGTITANGKTVEFSGKGYADHILQNKLSTGFSQRWHFVRFSDGDTAVNHTGWIPKQSSDKAYVGMTTVIENGKITKASVNSKVQSVSFSKDPVSGQSVPTEFKVIVDEPGFKLEMTAPFEKYRERIEVLDRVNVVARKIVGTFVARPFMYRTINKPTAVLKTEKGAKTLSGSAITQVVVFDK